MKKITTLLVLTLCFTFASKAQILLTIDSANYVNAAGVPLDTTHQIQISGVVMGPNAYPTPNGDVFMLSSHTRGIEVYSKHRFGYTVHDGDSVVVVGKVSTFHGMAEISPSTSNVGDTIYMVGTGTIDTPRVVTATVLNSNAGESTEALLIQVNGVDMSTVVNWPANHASHSFTAHATSVTGSLYMFIDSFMAADLWNGSAPGAGIYNVVGFGNQYVQNPPYVGGFSIEPRRRSDFILQTVGIRDIQNPLIASVYPNPASTRITAAFISETEGSYTATITDLMGRTVVSQEGNVNNGDNTLLFNTASLSTGMYILNLSAAGKTLVTKVNISK